MCFKEGGGRVSLTVRVKGKKSWGKVRGKRTTRKTIHFLDPGLTMQLLFWEGCHKPCFILYLSQEKPLSVSVYPQTGLIFLVYHKATTEALKLFLMWWAFWKALCCHTRPLSTKLGTGKKTLPSRPPQHCPLQHFGLPFTPVKNRYKMLPFHLVTALALVSYWESSL